MSSEIHKLFQSFVNDILKVFPEYEQRLTTYYKEILSSDEYVSNPKLDEFLSNIDLISEKVVNQDITLFQSDPIILQNISFKLIWNSDISTVTKNNIWDYLKTFCMLKIKLDSDEKISSVLKLIESKEKVKDKETFENIKRLKKLNEDLDVGKLQDVVDKNPESLTNNLGNIDEIFKDTGIGKIAKEITDDLDIEGIMKNGGGIEDIFSGGGMMNILQSISSKVSEGGDQLDSGKLVEEATSICDSMQGNPLFTSLLNMQGSMMGNMKEPTPKQSSDNNNIKNINVSDGSHNPNVTQQRLRKKLQEKKQNKLTVEKLD